MTNFEKIKLMTKEELAVLLDNVGSCSTCSAYTKDGCTNKEEECTPYILKWLDYEYKGECEQ